MSALPFAPGSALPYGSAYPAPIYGGSALPSAYTTSYPSYNAGFQSNPTFSVPAYPSYGVPVTTSTPATAVAPTSQKEEIKEKRKLTALEIQLELVRTLEKQLESDIQEVEMRQEVMDLQHSNETIALFQQQSAVLTAQNQKAFNVFRDIPDLEAPLESQFPPLGSSIPGGQSIPAPKIHPMQKLQELQSTIVKLRQQYDQKLQKAKQTFPH